MIGRKPRRRTEESVFDAPEAIVADDPGVELEPINLDGINTITKLTAFLKEHPYSGSQGQETLVAVLEKIRLQTFPPYTISSLLGWMSGKI